MPSCRVLSRIGCRTLVLLLHAARRPWSWLIFDVGKEAIYSTPNQMPSGTRMSGSVRIIFGILGATLLVGGVVGLFGIRPFDLEIASLCVGATVPGMVLLASAIWGQWPLDIM